MTDTTEPRTGSLEALREVLDQAVTGFDGDQQVTSTVGEQVHLVPIQQGIKGDTKSAAAVFRDLHRRSNKKRRQVRKPKPAPSTVPEARSFRMLTDKDTFTGHAGFEGMNIAMMENGRMRLFQTVIREAVRRYGFWPRPHEIATLRETVVGLGKRPGEADPTNEFLVELVRLCPAEPPCQADMSPRPPLEDPPSDSLERALSRKVTHPDGTTSTAEKAIITGLAGQALKGDRGAYEVLSIEEHRRALRDPAEPTVERPQRRAPPPGPLIRRTLTAGMGRLYQLMGISAAFDYERVWKLNAWVVDWVWEQGFRPKDPVAFKEAVELWVHGELKIAKVE